MTFGGGITIENGGLVEFGLQLKKPLSDQNWPHLVSTALGSYVLGNSSIGQKMYHTLKNFIKS